jgi:hypothetical protein
MFLAHVNKQGQRQLRRHEATFDMIIESRVLSADAALLTICERPIIMTHFCPSLLTPREYPSANEGQGWKCRRAVFE